MKKRRLEPLEKLNEDRYYDSYVDVFIAFLKLQELTQQNPYDILMEYGYVYLPYFFTERFIKKLSVNRRFSISFKQIHSRKKDTLQFLMKQILLEITIFYKKLDVMIYREDVFHIDRCLTPPGAFNKNSERFLAKTSFKSWSNTSRNNYSFVQL